MLSTTKVMRLGARLVTLALLLYCSSTPVFADQAPSPEELRAIDAVNRYLGAVMVGDVAGLREYLAPNLLEERRALLGNPNYPLTLQNAYANATFDIIGSQTVGSDKIRVDVRIVLNGQNAIHSRFLLAKIDNHYLIVAER